MQERTFSDPMAVYRGPDSVSCFCRGVTQAAEIMYLSPGFQDIVLLMCLRRVQVVLFGHCPLRYVVLLKHWAGI